MKRDSTIIAVCFLMSTLAQSDVLVEVNATMVAPSCNIHSEHNDSQLTIDFGSMKPEALDNTHINKDFPIHLSGCDFNKNLAIILNPKGTHTLQHHGQTLLATTTAGLGILFNEVTEGAVHVLDINKLQRIHPKKISATEYRADLQARLISTIPSERLAVGKFTSAMTILVTYD